jgi:sarcosine oxidase subunit alpha
MKPYRLTPIHHWHERHGARIEEIGGWKQVTDYGDIQSEISCLKAAVGVSDVTPLAKLEIRGRDCEGILGDLSNLPKPGSSASVVLSQASKAPHLVARLAIDRFLLIGGRESGVEVINLLKSATAGGKCVHLTDVTSTYAALHLVGPMSTRVLKKLGPVCAEAMSTSDCCQSPLARIWAFVTRRDVGGLPAWLLLVSRDYGEYFWECVLSAGNEFGIRPFGIRAEEVLMENEVADA